MKSLLDLVAPATGARRGARREAAKFALTVKPGVTYYSVVDNHGRYPGAPKRLLLEWVFTAPGRWIGQNARCGHMTAEGAWLGYGPLHEKRPAGIMTHTEFSRHNMVDAPTSADALARDLTPAGV